MFGADKKSHNTLRLFCCNDPFLIFVCICMYHRDLLRLTAVNVSPAIDLYIPHYIFTTYCTYPYPYPLYVAYTAQTHMISSHTISTANWDRRSQFTMKSCSVCVCHCCQSSWWQNRSMLIVYSWPVLTSQWQWLLMSHSIYGRNIYVSEQARGKP